MENPIRWRCSFPPCTCLTPCVPRIRSRLFLLMIYNSSLLSLQSSFISILLVMTQQRPCAKQDFAVSCGQFDSANSQLQVNCGCLKYFQQALCRIHVTLAASLGCIHYLVVGTRSASVLTTCSCQIVLQPVAFINRHSVMCILAKALDSLLLWSLPYLHTGAFCTCHSLLCQRKQSNKALFPSKLKTSAPVF